MSRAKVSCTIICYDEEDNIRAALESVKWCDEIVVVDSFSNDRTAEICREYTDQIHQRPWPGFVEQKAFALTQASHPWVLNLDADERVSPALASEISALLRSGAAAAGYRVPRVTFHLGRWIRSTDWYPDYQLRLYDRRRGRWSGRYVHESVQADGPVADLRGELLHYAYRDLAHHFQTMDRYTTLAAKQMFEDGRRAGWVELAVHPPAAFLRNYVLRGGFRDGVPGLIVSAMNARYVGLKFAKLWELCSPSTSTPRAPGAGDSSKSS
jgi:glycosyltransferase involved in cell wall biosynthesis